MKNYLAVFIGNEASYKASGWNALNEADRKERERAGIQAWDHWVTSHQNDIVEIGTPLGKTLRVSSRGIEPSRNELTAFTIVRAESHEAAAKLFEGHPHFMIFPGDSIEVMECLAIPR
ncbi:MULTISPECIES: hypothetical protein [unclassified Dyella]|uniref:hypothetical protein n=1 Tax=unclassified Dyella TaxID=2634549 RepID=UPI000CBD61D0|nr:MULTISPECIES: hypothetical protein [unclassified Dyella]MDR3446989.1 hypothetical protein [Dyella sp.]PMQ05870.1 hypothetical protein DyAD56_06390 [Dyella sp. AD56]